MTLSIVLFAGLLLLAVVYLYRAGKPPPRMSEEEMRTARMHRWIGPDGTHHECDVSLIPKAKKVTFKGGKKFTTYFMNWSRYNYGVIPLHLGSPQKRRTRSGRVEYRGYEIQADDESVGYVYHEYDKPTEDFAGEVKFHGAYAYRRGARIHVDELTSHGVLLLHATTTTFKFRDAQALIRHCLTNGVSLEGMHPDEMIALAQHCRAMELAKKRRAR